MGFKARIQTRVDTCFTNWLPVLNIFSVQPPPQHLQNVSLTVTVPTRNAVSRSMLCYLWVNVGKHLKATLYKTKVTPKVTKSDMYICTVIGFYKSMRL